MEEKKKQLNTVSNETTSQIKDLQWVPLYLAWDEANETIKMKVDKKDDFPVAAGLLFRMSEAAVKDALIDHSKEVSENESADNN